MLAAMRTRGRPPISSFCPAEPVLEWVRGADSGRRRPSAADARDFEAEYAARLAKAYPAGPHGTEVPFRRIFAVARKRE